jgi:hypothetical protein
VRAALKQGPVAFIVLGAAHDLSARVVKAAGDRCEYIRVTPPRVQELLEK